jgi:hypothetical protein
VEQLKEKKRPKYSSLTHPSPSLPPSLLSHSKKVEQLKEKGEDKDMKDLEDTKAMLKSLEVGKEGWREGGQG